MNKLIFYFHAVVLYLIYNIKKKNILMFVLKLVISLLEPLKNELKNYCNTISFIWEQLALTINKQASYSPQFAIFASLFYSVLPCTYQFFCNSVNCILPSYSTVCRVTLTCPLSPSNEQNGKNFLLYIRRKIKNLSSFDKTIILLVDKIHLKPYFDYKGGDVVGAAYNSTDAAFAFMISSVFFNYKDVVHVLPTRKMIAKALHCLLKKKSKCFDALFRRKCFDASVSMSFWPRRYWIYCYCSCDI